MTNVEKLKKVIKGVSPWQKEAETRRKKEKKSKPLHIRNVGNSADSGQSLLEGLMDADLGR